MNANDVPLGCRGASDRRFGGACAENAPIAPKPLWDVRMPHNGWTNPDKVNVTPNNIRNNLCLPEDLVGFVEPMSVWSVVEKPSGPKFTKEAIEAVEPEEIYPLSQKSFWAKKQDELSLLSIIKFCLEKFDRPTVDNKVDSVIKYIDGAFIRVDSPDCGRELERVGRRGSGKPIPRPRPISSRSSSRREGSSNRRHSSEGRTSRKRSPFPPPRRYPRPRRLPSPKYHDYRQRSRSPRRARSPPSQLPSRSRDRSRSRSPRRRRRGSSSDYDRYSPRPRQLRSPSYSSPYRSEKRKKY